ncbi:hypothetical protein T12_9739 [Trichinella patagoniensis]|uniref:Uncharacterized protein n=1 Tax=Trichinella patagoniensis TaxID=990121 RepID=A0A0V0YTY0_9BILA|nr:hypothetical protein T12_9739 [Trichinella patagoniensis]
MVPKVSTLPILIHKEFANLKFSLYATSMPIKVSSIYRPF